MERERLERLSWRWGFVALAAMALLVWRGAKNLWVEVRELSQMVTMRELLDRASQLKPALWKAQGMVVMAILFALVLSSVIVMVWIAAWRSARRGEE
jgi:hypothetical protein